MSLQIVALLIVTLAFAALLWRVFAPGNKAYFEAMSRIPLDEEQVAQKSNRSSAKE